MFGKLLGKGSREVTEEVGVLVGTENRVEGRRNDRRKRQEREKGGGGSRQTVSKEREGGT